jgi:pyruvate-formate lyase-activating enzyme
MASRTVQVHLSRLCNLSCAHCYSRSGPAERESLSLTAVARFLADARDEGYGVAAFSGGEPFLHPRFREILEETRALGMSAIAVTNGTVLARKSAAEALALLDLVAVSVDGPAPVHDRLRGSRTAFARMLDGLDQVRRSAIPFGIAHTVTRDSLPHLPWMAAFAREAGARLLQLHPLGLVGAAADNALGALDGEVLARAYLAALALRAEHGEALAIHVDLFNLEQVRARPALVVPPERAGDGMRLADAINPLVLLSDGRIAPICHDLAARFPVGDLARESLAAAAPRFLGEGLPRLHDFCRALAERILAEEDPWPYLNWYELLAREAAGDGGGAPAAGTEAGPGMREPLGAG